MQTTASGVANARGLRRAEPSVFFIPGSRDVLQGQNVVAINLTKEIVALSCRSDTLANDVSNDMSDLPHL